MNHKRITVLILSFLLTLLLLVAAACTASDNGAAQAEATEASEAAATATTAPAPSSTAEPTATETPAPSPTPTAQPSATATTAPTATAETAETTSQALSPDAFCGDEEVRTLLEALQTAVAEEDEAQLGQLIHPEEGLRVRVSWWNPEVHFTGEQVETLLSSDAGHDWGVEDGSGKDISGSFSDVIMPRLQNDLVPAEEAGCSEILHGGTAGMVQLPDEYEGETFFSLYRPAPPDGIEMDWGTWAIGVKQWQGEPRITLLVHYKWEI